MATVKNGGKIETLEWKSDRNKILKIYANCCIDESDLTEFGRYESVHLHPENLFKQHHLVPQILHQGEWFSECGTVVYGSEESTLNALQSHVIKPEKIIFKRPFSDEIHRRSFKGAVLKLKWPLRPISKVKVYLEDGVKVRGQGEGRNKFKIKLMGNTEIICRESRTNNSIYILTGNFDSLSDEEVSSLVPRQLDIVFCDHKVVCERDKFSTGYDHRCRKGFERKLLTLHLEQWNLRQMPHLRLSDFKIEVLNYDAKADDFVHIEMIYMNRKIIESFVSTHEKNLHFGTVLDRKIILSRALDSIHCNMELYYQMALPSRKVANYFRSRTSALMTLLPEENSLRLLNLDPADVENEAVLELRERTEDKENKSDSNTIDLCYEVLQKIQNGVTYQHYTTAVCERTLNKIGKKTNTFLDLHDKEDGKYVYTIHGDERDKTTAIKLLEARIRSRDAPRTLTLNLTYKDKFTLILRKFGSRLSFTTTDENMKLLSKSTTKNPVLNIATGCLTYWNKDVDFVNDIQELLQTVGQGQSEGQGQSLGECASCLCDIDRVSDKFTLSICGHSFHTECLQVQISVALAERSFPLQCVECSEDLYWKDIILPDLGGDADKNPDEVLKKTLLSMLLDLTLKSKGTLKSCVTPGCAGIYKVKDGNLGDRPELHACALCDVTFCSSCQECLSEQHYCQGVVDELLKQWMDENRELRKRCPVCHQGIEKMSGCNKVVCYFCHACLCWKCNKVFEASQVYKHLAVARVVG